MCCMQFASFPARILWLRPVVADISGLGSADGDVRDSGEVNRDVYAEPLGDHSTFSSRDLI